ncbi:MAG: DUF3551 domain-containing protein [Xanthobacteraceae bacterium]|nr:DUF3551 domain-containing protein [Xanthobacteraceae bacterium]
MKSLRIMKKGLLAASLLLSTISYASADPYRWCAEYGGGGSNCYFVTLNQCQAAVSGNGGFCRANPFYTGADWRSRPATFGVAGGGQYRVP